MTIDDGICENCLAKNHCDVLPYSNNCNEVRAMAKHDKQAYNKAIDDFAEKIKENISESLIWGMIANCFKYKNMNDTSDKIVDYVINTANEIAEQLKAGGESE